MSDSREERAISATVPPDLEEWLEERAATLGVDRETILVQLLSAYRAADDLDGDLATALGEEARDGAIGDALVERLDERIAAFEREFQSKIVDVRERVIQVKKEADTKAPKSHDHEEFAAVEDLAGTVEELETALDELEGRVEGFTDRHSADLAALREDLEADVERAAEERAEIDDRLADAADKLRRVAWVVSDLKDDVGADGAHDTAVERIKRAAAQEGVTAATCDGCGETVEISLLTAPECPHCEATVSDVRPAGGIFRKKARLVAAAQLAAGDEGADE